jgi:predicted MFS family arabinose efflux permease
MESKKIPPVLWNRPFIFLNLSFFLVFTNIAFLYLYPLALHNMVGGHHMVGLVMGLFSVASVLSRPFFGKLVALKGEFRIIFLGMAVSLVASLGYNLITSFGPGMLLTRIIHGIGFSAFIAGGFSLAARLFHPEKRAEAFGILGACLMAAMALAPALGEVLVRKWGFHALYIAAAGSIILAWLASSMAVTLPSSSLKEYQQTRLRYLSHFKNRSFLFLLISTLIFAHCQSTVSNFIALIATGKGASSGPFFSVSYSVAIIILLTTGRLIDRYGLLVFLRFPYPVFALGILLIPGMIKSSFFLVPAILYGIGMGLLFPAHNALAAGHGSKDQKPAIMSLFTAIYDTGFITGAIVSGWFANLTGLDILFVACGILGFLGFLLVILSPISNECFCTS